MTADEASIRALAALARLGMGASSIQQQQRAATRIALHVGRLQYGDAYVLGRLAQAEDLLLQLADTASLDAGAEVLGEIATIADSVLARSF